MIQLALTNASVLDVETGEIAPDQTLLIDGGRFVEVSAGRPLTTEERTVDCRGRVMPGLCDAHVHVTAATPDLYSAQAARAVDRPLEPRLERALRRRAGDRAR